MPLTFSEALERVETIPTRFQTFDGSINLCKQVTEYALRASAYVFLFFLIHQLFFWISRDPEKAFRMANLFIDFVEISWDLLGILYNALAEVANAALLPLWNAFTFYVISPGITLSLEVFSQIFLRKSYTGVIKEDDFPYGGFVCDSSIASATWCGRFVAYDQRLAEGNSKTKTDSITFGTATARRLSELADGEVDFDVPSFSLGSVVGALDGLTTDAILLGGSAADLLMGVLYEVLSTTAVFLFDATYTILTTVFDVIKLLIKSGMLQTLLSIGIDFLLILALEIAVPMLIAIVDAVVCTLQLFMWGTWKSQLECGTRHTHTYVPVVTRTVLTIPVAPCDRSRAPVLQRPHRCHGLDDVHEHPPDHRALWLHPRGHPQQQDGAHVHRKRGEHRPRRLKHGRSLPLAGGHELHGVLRLSLP